MFKNICIYLGLFAPIFSIISVILILTKAFSYAESGTVLRIIFLAINITTAGAWASRSILIDRKQFTAILSMIGATAWLGISFLFLLFIK